MYGWHLEDYQRRIAAFGWETIIIDGHSFPEILKAYKKAGQIPDKPNMIITKTVKGKGVSFVGNKTAGMALPRNQRTNSYYTLKLFTEPEKFPYLNHMLDISRSSF